MRKVITRLSSILLIGFLASCAQFISIEPTSPSEFTKSLAGEWHFTQYTAAPPPSNNLEYRWHFFENGKLEVLHENEGPYKGTYQLQAQELSIEWAAEDKRTWAKQTFTTAIVKRPLALAKQGSELLLVGAFLGRDGMFRASTEYTYYGARPPRKPYELFVAKTLSFAIDPPPDQLKPGDTCSLKVQLRFRFAFQTKAPEKWTEEQYDMTCQVKEIEKWGVLEISYKVGGQTLGEAFGAKHSGPRPYLELPDQLLFYKDQPNALFTLQSSEFGGKTRKTP